MVLTNMFFYFNFLNTFLIFLAFTLNICPICQITLKTGSSSVTLFNISCTGITNVVNFTFYGKFIFYIIVIINMEMSSSSESFVLEILKTISIFLD